MTRAIWNDTVIAESDETIIVEGNHYFPPQAVRAEFIQPTEHHTVCSWKGTASYYNVEVNGQVNANAAWYYPQPSEAAKQIAGYVAFWRGVRVEA
jgi:uncharacterized protein (DUF427 family)